MDMNNMSERIAHALGSQFPEIRQMDTDVRCAVANAAIIAMREPTDKMLEYAGEMAGYCGLSSDEDHKDWWRSMIDAALGE